MGSYKCTICERVVGTPLTGEMITCLDPHCRRMFETRMRRSRYTVFVLMHLIPDMTQEEVTVTKTVSDVFYLYCVECHKRAHCTNAIINWSEIKKSFFFKSINKKMEEIFVRENCPPMGYVLVPNKFTKAELKVPTYYCVICNAPLDGKTQLMTCCNAHANQYEILMKRTLQPRIDDLLKSKVNFFGVLASIIGTQLIMCTRCELNTSCPLQWVDWDKIATECNLPISPGAIFKRLESGDKSGLPPCLQ